MNFQFRRPQHPEGAEATVNLSVPLTVNGVLYCEFDAEVDICRDESEHDGFGITEMRVIDLRSGYRPTVVRRVNGGTGREHEMAVAILAEFETPNARERAEEAMAKIEAEWLA